MAESKQHWLDRNRPPRVQITYDVETGGAVEKKEIPFVVGVMSDLSGDNTPTTKLKERKFVEIDRDNFNHVMSSLAPSLKFAVPSRLGGTATTLAVDLSFVNMDRFRPEQVVHHVPELRHLYEARTRLNDLLAKLEGNDELNKALFDLIADDSKLGSVKGEAASTVAADDAASAAATAKDDADASQ
jgi:type VI secretion system protein ImpB